MDAMAEIRMTFFQECEEQLAALEAGLMTMEEGDTSSDTVNAVFRAVHSIKGGAGAFKLNTLVSFAHIFETALDKVRGGSLAPSAEVMKVLLRAADVLADLVVDAREGRESLAQTFEGVSEEIQALLAGDSGESEEELEIDFAPLLIAIDEPAALPTNEADNRQTFDIAFRPEDGLYAKANEPLLLLRELAALGECHVTCSTSQLPDLESMKPECSCLSWTARLSTDKNEVEIREVFEFVDGDCLLEISKVEPAMPSSPITTLEPESSDADAELAKAAALPELGSTVQQDSGATVQLAQRPAATAAQPTIRVDLDRVDRLINLVGELVINQAMLTQRVHQSGHVNDSRVATSLDELEHLTRELQESVMAIRAQPVKPLFQRMSRIVREVADATGKSVRLRTEGEGTEVDKTVLELLADPLTHMIRNAVDHGLEMPEVRAKSGKAAEGVVRLSAAHRSGRVVIEVADDGAGIDRPKVLEAAIRKGLVSKDVQLSDSEIDNLLFLPGFSTASSVSNISGRGVGMDVVKRSIQALGGRIATSSQRGQGSTFTMSLPLTLAVLDGIIVSIGDQTLVIPLTTIVETLKPDAGWLHPMGDGAYVMRIRGSFVPLIDVGAELGMREASLSPRNGVAILVETEQGSRSALLVDGIQDQRQVVIKSLETNYARVTGIAAATILGDGRVAMILDVDSLVGNRATDPALAELNAA